MHLLCHSLAPYIIPQLLLASKSTFYLWQSLGGEKEKVLLRKQWLWWWNSNWKASMARKLMCLNKKLFMGLEVHTYAICVQGGWGGAHLSARMWNPQTVDTYWIKDSRESSLTVCWGLALVCCFFLKVICSVIVSYCKCSISLLAVSQGISAMSIVSHTNKPKIIPPGTKAGLAFP